MSHLTTLGTTLDSVITPHSKLIMHSTDCWKIQGNSDVDQILGKEDDLVWCFIMCSVPWLLSLVREVFIMYLFTGDYLQICLRCIMSNASQILPTLSFHHSFIGFIYYTYYVPGVTHHPVDTGKNESTL